MEYFEIPSYVCGRLEEHGDKYQLTDNKKGSVIVIIPKPEKIRDTISTLKNIQKDFETKYSIREIAEIIDSAGNNLFYGDRQNDIISVLEITTGRSREVIKHDIFSLKKFLNKKYLYRMISDSEGKYRGIFDEPVSKITDLVHRRLKPLGLIFHNLAGNSPMVATSLVLGVLTKNTNLAKTGSGDPVTAVYLAESINEVDTLTGKTIAVFYWPARINGRINEIYSTIFTENPVNAPVEGVACWGDEESINTIKSLAKASGIKIIEHGPKYSFDIFFTPPDSSKAELVYANLIKDSIISHEQEACISTRCIFVVGDFGEIIANGLAETLKKLETIYPNNKIKVGEIIGRRIMYLKKRNAKILTPDKNKANWTIVYLNASYELKLSDINACYNRFIIIKEVDTVDEIIQFIKTNNLGRYLQVCGVYPEHELKNPNLLEKLWSAGFTKICSVGSHSKFYPGASHDGANPLLDYTKYVTSDKIDIITKFIIKLSNVN